MVSGVIASEAKQSSQVFSQAFSKAFSKAFSFYAVIGNEVFSHSGALFRAALHVSGLLRFARNDATLVCMQ
jgi:hypothetical protein